MRWIVIADHAEAKIFKQSAQGQELLLTTRIEHPEGRMRNQDLKEGRAGRSFESGPQTHQRHAMGTQESPREHDEHEFARLLVSVLDHGRVQRRFDEFVLSAEPGFLGEITARMDSPLKRLMVRAIRKDLVRLSEHELNAFFKDEPNS